MKRKGWIILCMVMLVPVFLFAGIVYYVYSQQDKMTAVLLERVNESFAGRIHISKTKVAPFVNFPYVSVDLQGVQFYENKHEESDLLYEIKDIYVGFNIKELLQGQYNVYRLQLDGGEINLVNNECGELNIIVAKNLNDSKASTDEESKEINFNIEKLKISKVNFRYYDVSSELSIQNNIESATAKIKYNENHIYFDVASEMNMDIYKNGKKTFFVDKYLKLDMEWDYQEQDQLLSILPSSIQLGEALFKIEGTVDVPDDMNMNLQLSGEKPDFNIFAAFAPPDVGKALQTYQNAGQIYFNGSIVGKAFGMNAPSINVDFGCQHAYFINTDVNKKVDNLRFNGSFTNGKDRTFESSELRLTNFYAKPEEGVFQGNLFIRNFKDPYIKINLHADLDLEFVGQFFQIEGVEHIKGQILLDMNFDELVDMEFPTENLAKLKSGIDSDLRIIDLQFNIPGFTDRVRDMNGHAFMRQGKLELDSLNFKIGDSDFHFDGYLSDFPALFHQEDKNIEIKFKASSKVLNIKELLSFDTTLSRKYDEHIEDFSIELTFQTRAKELFTFEYLPKGEFYIDDLYARLKHYPHTLHDFNADIIITDRDFELIDFSGEVDSSNFHFTGVLNNYTKWFQENPVGDSKLEFDLVSSFLKLDNLLSYKGENYIPEDYRSEVFRDLKLHGRVDMHYNQGFHSVDLNLDELTAKMKIHPLKLEKFSGRAHYENEHLAIENFYGKMGKSDFTINMSYYVGLQKERKRKDNFFKLKSRVLDMDALMSYQGPEIETDHSSGFNLFEIPFTDIAVELHVDKLNYHRYWLENFRSEMRMQEDHYIYIDTLSLNLADGGLQLNGYFNGSDPDNIYFNSTLYAQNLDLDKLMIKFENFGQDQFINENIHGKVSGTINSKFKMYPDFTPIVDKSEAHMDLMITEGSLVRFSPMLVMSDYFKDKNLNLVRFDTLQNQLDLKEGVLYIPNMNLNTSLGFLELSGKQGLDLSMDYIIRIPLKMVTQVGWRSLFGKKNDQEVDPNQIDEIQSPKDGKRTRFVNVKVSGTIEEYNVSLTKAPKK